MPCARWTTRSPSRSSRKLSIALPRRRRGSPPQLAALKQFGAADQRSSVRGPGEILRRVCRRAGADHRPAPMAVLAKISPSRWRSASVLAIRKTSCSAPLWSSSSRTLAMSPLNRCTDSICRRHVDPGRGLSDRRSRGQRELPEGSVHVAAETRIRPVIPVARSSVRLRPASGPGPRASTRYRAAGSR